MTKPITYLPLPKQVKIGTSKIHGMGVFAVEDIQKINHINNDRINYG